MINTHCNAPKGSFRRQSTLLSTCCLAFITMAFRIGAQDDLDALLRDLDEISESHAPPISAPKKASPSRTRCIRRDETKSVVTSAKTNIPSQQLKNQQTARAHDATNDRVSLARIERALANINTSHWECVFHNSQATIVNARLVSGWVDVPSQIDGFPVTAIGAHAFSGNEELSCVTIPRSVRDIGMGAFMNCSNLRRLYISTEVTNIGAYAFCGCASLMSFETPRHLRRIGAAAFQGCTGFRAVMIPSTVSRIDDQAFEGCTRLQTLFIEPGVEAIGMSAFAGCRQLKVAAIPKTGTHIAADAFADCPVVSFTATSNGSPSARKDHPRSNRNHSQSDVKRYAFGLVLFLICSYAALRAWVTTRRMSATPDSDRHKEAVSSLKNTEAASHGSSKWQQACRATAVEHALTKTALPQLTKDVYRACMEDGLSVGDAMTKFSLSRESVEKTIAAVDKMISAIEQEFLGEIKMAERA